VVAGAVAEAVEVVPVAVGKDFSGKRKENYLFVPLTKFLTRNGPSYTKPV
jgi:hypothetical protein